MTTTTPRPNRDALNHAIDVYRDAMRPFIVRTLKRVKGAKPEDLIELALPPNQADEVRRARASKAIGSVIDVGHFPRIVQKNWAEAFASPLQDRVVQNLIWVISHARNEAAHPSESDLDHNYVMSRLSDIADVLKRADQAAAKTVEDIRAELLDLAREPRAEPAATAPLDIKAGGGVPNLKPWWKVIRPAQDVTQGAFRDADFAAQLQTVYDGSAAQNEYGDPVAFFARTYLTPGMRALLVNALKRVAGNGGDPVIQMKTGFGGGKTHSLIALYHLMTSMDALSNPPSGAGGRNDNDALGLMREAGLDADQRIETRIAVLDGLHLAPTDEDVTEKGDPLNTLWGVMAHQLGGQAAYDLIGEAARTGSAPGGSQLDRIFQRFGPCVILVDELLAYTRNANKAFDSVLTFLQSLTQAVSRSSNSVLVVTLPAAKAEAGGDIGQEALEKIESEMDSVQRVFARTEVIWRPLEVNEAFEVVRRRLFGDEIDEEERDAACKAFVDMYGKAKAEYPQGVFEQRYLERMKACYPIHPEIFDRLYEDWSSIPQFQRTRGVLRVMANCVSRLYRSEDPAPLIMPGGMPFSDNRVSDEFVTLLGGQWDAAMNEVDKDNNRADELDAASQRFLEVGGAARRVARAVFLGSARGGARIGVDRRQIHLGVILPGQGAPRYNEALDALSGQLHYMYNDAGRYYFLAEPNLNRLANDREEQVTDREIDDQVRQAAEGFDPVRSYGRMPVVLFPSGSEEVADVESLRLVILPMSKPMPTRSQERDSAREEALEILRNRGEAGRSKKNTLLFLAAKSDDVRKLRNKTRRFLAWTSILEGEGRVANLTDDRRTQAQTAKANAGRAMNAALASAYRWLLVPFQPDPQKDEYAMTAYDTNPEGEIIAAAISKATQSEALVEKLSPSALLSMLQQYVWSNPVYSDNATVETVWQLMTSHVYLHRLRNWEVLRVCVEQGIREGVFGCADYAEGQYRNPRCGPETGALMEIKGSVLLPADKARRLREEQENAGAGGEGGAPGPATPTGGLVSPGPTPLGGTTPGAALSSGPVRLTARKRISGDISLDDVNALRQEIIRNLLDDGGSVTVEIIVTGRKPGGFSENAARPVRENSKQLSLEFDESRDA